MEITIEQWKKTLSDAGLANAGAGVVFPWGVKIVDLGGKKALQPMTPEEYRHVVKEETGKTLSDKEVLEPRCGITNTGCYSYGCTGAGGRCIISYNPAGHICSCSYL